LVLLDKRDDRNVSYLSGPKLARYYLDPMVQKGLVVTLVLDCCFSASVYRRNGADIRFLPYNAKNDSFRQCDLEVEDGFEPGTVTRGMRDASMRLNWLMDPDGYAILTACGPNQEGGEIVLESGHTYGKLSYFLLQSFNDPGGCRKTHATIYRYLCAELQSHPVQQNPVLYGRKDQGFFGEVDLESYSSLQVIKSPGGELRLLAGQAHGFCQGDRFALYPSVCGPIPSSKEDVVNATIARLRGLTSILEVQDMTIDGSQRMWTASALTRLRLKDYPVRLHPDLPKRDQWKAALAERFLAINEDDSQPKAVFHITPSEDKDFEVRDQQDRQVVNLFSPTQKPTCLQAAEKIEHLAKFALVKDLANTDCGGSFQKRFDVYIISCGNRFDSNTIVEVKHEEKIELVLENFGDTPLFFSIYNLAQHWQIQNLLSASHVEVPSPENGQQSCQQSKKIKMMVPERMKEKRLQLCEDIIKVFVTPQLSLFDLLELPKVGEAMEKISPSRADEQQVRFVPEQPEDWASPNFHIRVSL